MHNDDARPDPHSSMFYYFSPESRVPADHPCQATSESASLTTVKSAPLLSDDLLVVVNGIGLDQPGLALGTQSVPVTAEGDDLAVWCIEDGGGHHRVTKHL